MPLKSLLRLLVDCSENVHVNKITFKSKLSPKVPGWKIDVNKGPWTPKEDSLVGMLLISLLINYHFKIKTNFYFIFLKIDPTLTFVSLIH